MLRNKLLTDAMPRSRAKRHVSVGCDLGLVLGSEPLRVARVGLRPVPRVAVQRVHGQPHVHAGRGLRGGTSLYIDTWKRASLSSLKFQIDHLFYPSLKSLKHHTKMWWKTCFIKWPIRLSTKFLSAGSLYISSVPWLLFTFLKHLWFGLSSSVIKDRNMLHDISL